jgi:uncharacterized membrane protein
MTRKGWDMATIEESIDVKAPLQTVYNQWTQFEEFPKFMDGVESVSQLSDDRLHWVAEIGGQRKEWDARITEQRPDERIAWASDTGTGNAGVVTFHRIDDQTTRVMLQMELYPEDWKEKAADLAGVAKRRVKKDLENFKQFLESRGVETGAWRGEIDTQKKAG